jgi:hypothetical protein
MDSMKKVKKTTHENGRDYLQITYLIKDLNQECIITKGNKLPHFKICKELDDFKEKIYKRPVCPEKLLNTITH